MPQGAYAIEDPPCNPPNREGVQWAGSNLRDEVPDVVRGFEQDLQVEGIILADARLTRGPASEQGDEIRRQHIFEFHGPLIFEFGVHRISFRLIDKAIAVPS